MAKPGEFTHHEILSQAASWEAALALLQSSASEIQSACGAEKSSYVIFTGCGSTYYLSLAAAALFFQLTGHPARALPASELWLYPGSAYPAQERTLLVAVSRSGETSETLNACRAFNDDRRGRLVTLTCYPDSPLASLGSLNLAFPSGQERSVAQTRSFSTLYLAATALAVLAAGRSDLFAALRDLPQAGARLLESASPLLGQLGEDLSLDRFYFLGSGPRYGLAAELSLKMKEMSLSHSEPFHFLEFRHGPKSMVASTALVVGLRGETQRRRETAVLDEMQAMGARLLVIDEQAAQVEFHSGLDEAIRNILYLPAGQLLAFERSLAKGLNPDHPAHLEAVVKLENL
jgi:glucosamine--fructose-6-phosphate aminotransferase (isomerizing)